MKNVPEQFSQFSSAAMASAAKMSKVSMDSAEKLMALQLEFAKASLADATKLAKVLSSVKDVQDLASLRSVTAESAMEKLMGYSRQVYEVASDAQAEMTKLAEERMAMFNQTPGPGRRQREQVGPGGQRSRRRRDEVHHGRDHRRLRQLHEGRPQPRKLQRCRHQACIEAGPQVTGPTVSSSFIANPKIWIKVQTPGSLGVFFRRLEEGELKTERLRP